MEQMDGVQIVQCHNGREYTPSKLPRLSVDVYRPRLIQFTGSFAVFGTDTCQPFRDVSTLSGDTLAERHERTM